MFQYLPNKNIFLLKRGMVFLKRLPKRGGKTYRFQWLIILKLPKEGKVVNISDT